MDKKGFGIGEIAPIGIAFLVIVITLGLGATVLSTIKTGQTADSYAANISNYGLTSLNTISSWLPTIALVVVVAIILGIVTMYLMNKQ
jgi:hypothetical protein